MKVPANVRDWARKGLVVAAAIVVAVAVLSPLRARRGDRLGVGGAVPEFRLPDVQQPSREVTLADFKGKAVLITFWAPW